MKFFFKYSIILSLKNLLGVTPWTTPLIILIGFVDNGKNLGILLITSNLEIKSKLLGIIELSFIEEN